MEERMKMIDKVYEEKFGGLPKHWVRAPGRVDLMGSHTDYNEGYILTMPLDLDTVIAFSPVEDETVTLHSINVDETCSFSSSVPHSRDLEGWITYIAAVARVFRDKGYSYPGLKGVIHSSVPLGGGLSSSAALECAAAEMFMAAGGFRIEKKQAALYCQQAENDYVGMPCGILDQYTSFLGQEGSLILLDCRSLSHILVRLPENIRVVLCDTRAPHVLVGSEYETRRNQCFQGAKILHTSFPEVKTLRDTRLRQLEECRGDMEEDVYKRCTFIIEENQRVLEVSAAISLGTEEAGTLRDLFNASYGGARDLYEITVTEMERMHEAMVSAPGVLASRQAGGGFGGCMSSLVHAHQVEEFSAHVMKTYRQSTGLEPLLYSVSPGDGAGAMLL